MPWRQLSAADSLPQTKAEQYFAPDEPIARIHLQKPYRCPTLGGLANNARSVVREVQPPFIMPRMEEARDLSRIRINPGKIGALVAIALRAGESQIFQIIGAAMLTGDDVVDMKSQGGMSLRQPTVFTAFASPLAHELPGGVVHQDGWE